MRKSISEGTSKTKFTTEETQKAVQLLQTIFLYSKCVYIVEKIGKDSLGSLSKQTNTKQVDLDDKFPKDTNIDKSAIFVSNKRVMTKRRLFELGKYFCSTISVEMLKSKMHLLWYAVNKVTDEKSGSTPEWVINGEKLPSDIIYTYLIQQTELTKHDIFNSMILYEIITFYYMFIK